MSDLFKDQDNKLDRGLIAYAFLAQTSRGEGNLVAGLAPIFKPIASMKTGEKFDIDEFSQLLDQLYGLKIHPWAIEDLLPQLEISGLLERVTECDGVHIYVYKDIEGEFNAVSEEDIQRVLDRFVEFASILLEDNGLPVARKALESAFLAQLVEMSFISVLLNPDRSKEDRRSSSTLSLKKSKEQSQWEEDKSTKAKVEVICASFIVEIYHTDETLYDLVMQIATGAILSEVILNIQDPGETSSLDGLTVVLDSPFLMSALGLTGEEDYQFASEICNQLKENGATLAAFDHSVAELIDNLKGVISSTNSGVGYGPTARRLKNEGFATYVNGVINNVELILEQNEIEVLSKVDEEHFRYFTHEQQENFQSGLGYYHNGLAQHRDAQSVAELVRRRRGKQVKMGRFQSAGLVFITENTDVVDKATKFLKRHNLYNDGEVPPALSEKYLAGLLWALYGGKGSELTKNLLLANCAAALEPRNDVINRMHQFLKDIDDKQMDLFSALMTNERAGQYMMQASLGDSSLITDRNAPQVLERMQNALIEKVTTEQQEEINQLRTKHTAALKEKDEQHARLQQRLNEEQDEKLSSRIELKEATKQLVQIQNYLRDERDAKVESQRIKIIKSVKKANKYVKRVSWIIAAVFAFFSAFVLEVVLQDMGPIYRHLAAALVSLLSFVFAPPYLCSGPLDRLRNRRYRHYLARYDVEYVKEQSIDWESETLAEVEKAS